MDQWMVLFLAKISCLGGKLMPLGPESWEAAKLRRPKKEPSASKASTTKCSLDLLKKLTTK